jgi:hypothetical protein
LRVNRIARLARRGESPPPPGQRPGLSCRPWQKKSAAS